MADQPSRCGGVGSAKDSSNQRWTNGRNDAMRLALYPHRRRTHAPSSFLGSCVGVFAAFSAATALRRLLRQLVRGVQRRDLVALRQRWIVEDGPQEIVEAPAEGEHGLADVNELGGTRPDGVHTQQTPVLAVEEELEQPAVVPQDLAAGDL